MKEVQGQPIEEQFTVAPFIVDLVEIVVLDMQFGEEDACWSFLVDEGQVLLPALLLPQRLNCPQVRYIRAKI